MTRLIRRAAARWRALAGTAPAAAVALGLLVFACTLLAVAGPAAAAQLRTGAFRQYIATAPAAAKEVTGSVSDTTLGIGSARGLDAGQVTRGRSQLRASLRHLPLAPAAADWSGVTTPLLAVSGYGRSALAVLPPKIELGYRDALARHVRVISGKLPEGGTATSLPAAVTPATARRYGLRPGSRLPLPGTSLAVTVAGIVTPRDPAAPFWTTDPLLAAPELENPTGSNSYWIGGVLISAASVVALQNQVNVSGAQVTWTFPLALGRLTAAQSAALQPVLAGALATDGHVTAGVAVGGEPIPVDIALSSQAGGLIAGFQAEAASADSVLNLLSVSLAVLAAVVVLLAGWLLAEQRRGELATMRARGASRRQLAGTILAATAVTAVPGALAGAAAGTALVPAAAGVTLSWTLAGLVAVVALAGPVLITACVHRVYAPAGRADAPPGRVHAARRLVIEAALVLGSAGGLAVLRYQGQGAAGDYYASAAPALAAVAVAIIVIRLYPLAVRGLLALTGRRAGPAAFLGLARAARAAGSPALPAFALVLALALVSFAGMVRGAVLTGQADTSWQQVGADAVITQSAPVSPALQRAVAAVPGVQLVAAAGAATAETASGQQYPVLAVDPGRYAALTGGTPLPQPPAAFTSPRPGGPVPALASAALAGAGRGGPVSILGSTDSLRLRVAGLAASMSALANQSGYLILPAASLGGAAPQPTMLLVRGPHLDTAALAAAVARHGRGRVLLRSAVLAGLQDAPLQHGAVTALALGGAAAVACGLLVLLLSLLLSAPSRQLTLARLATMGLSPAQGRLAAVLEALPQLVAVLAGGAVTAAALGPLLGPALQLSVFTGSPGAVPVRLQPAWLAAAAAVVLAAAIATLTGQTAGSTRKIARSGRTEGTGA